MQLNDAFLKLVIPPIASVWQSIAYVPVKAEFVRCRVLAA